MDYKFEKYQLSIQDHLKKTCSIRLEQIEGNELALQEERRKIYLIANGREVLYVGEANSSIKKRLQRGCVSFNYYITNDKARGGYKGYKWLDHNANPHRVLNLTVAIFDEAYDPKEKRSIIEAVEGELVYLIRNKTGLWPKFQNEIHFTNEPDAYATAERIYQEAILK